MRLALPVTVVLLLSAAAPAFAQMGPPPCMNEFMPLRDDAQKKAAAIKAASDRHATPVEACQLFKVFSAAEAKVMKYVEQNGTWCGMPPDLYNTMKTNHAKTVEIQTRVCKAAAMGGAAPAAGPSLSDALGSSSLPDTQNIKQGRGTFDTLTGTPLGNAR